MSATSTSVTAHPNAVMRPMAGLTELEVAEAAAHPGTRPERVTAVLNAVYERIADSPVTPELVRHLPCGTREWLLQRAAHFFNPDLTWFEATCAHCGEPYDLSLRLVDTGLQYTADGRPDVEVETSLGRRSFQLPNGEHEEEFARRGEGEEPRRAFAALCGRAENAAAEAMQFDGHDLDLIDQALEAASPDVADEVITNCPCCGSETTASIDPLRFAFPDEGPILEESHALASAYGWTHEDILSLSARHRSHYAALIIRDRRGARTARSLA